MCNMSEEERDVDIVDRDDLDPEFQLNFTYRWIVQWPNGFSISVPTSEQAILLQSQWRACEDIADPSR